MEVGHQLTANHGVRRSMAVEDSFIYNPFMYILWRQVSELGWGNRWPF